VAATLQRILAFCGIPRALASQGDFALLARLPGIFEFGAAA
jgi:hypothetical protein